MTVTSSLQTVAVAEQRSLTGKLEFAILSVLIHYNGSYDETLIDWYAALRLGLPELAHPDEVRDVFERLSAEELSSSGTTAPPTMPATIAFSPQDLSAQL